MNKLSILASVAFSAALTISGSALAGNAAAGKNKTAMCQGCHGIPGYHASFPAVFQVPKLGGQHASYLVKALQAYKSGERSNATMRAIAASLSEQDMADLAAYYAADAVKTAGK